MNPIVSIQEDLSLLERKRLTHPIRDPRAGYSKTLEVLKNAKEINPNMITKSSIILGLGEKEEEIYQKYKGNSGISVFCHFNNLY